MRPILGAIVLMALTPLPAWGCPNGQIACPKSPGGCRTLRDLAPLDIEASGHEVVVDFLLTRLRVGKKTLQTIAPKVQEMQSRYRMLVLEFNACALTDDQYEAKRREVWGIDEHVQSLANAVASIRAVEDRADASEAQLTEARRELEGMGARIRQLASKTSALRVGLNEAMDRIRRLNPETIAASVRESLRAEQAALEGRIDALDVNQEELASAIAAMETGLREQQRSVDARLDGLENRIARIERRFHDGLLSSRHYLLTVMASGTWLDGAMRPGGWLAVETLSPGESILKGVTVALEVGGAWWKDTPSYTTLPGTDPVTYDRNDSLVLADVWIRRYFGPRTTFRLYAGAGAGFLAQGAYGWGDIGLAAQAAAGIFFYPASWRVGIEARASTLQTRSTEKRFDPFGGVESDDRRRFRPAYTLGLVATPFAW